MNWTLLTLTLVFRESLLQWDDHRQVRVPRNVLEKVLANMNLPVHPLSPDHLYRLVLDSAFSKNSACSMIQLKKLQKSSVNNLIIQMPNR